MNKQSVEFLQSRVSNLEDECEQLRDALRFVLNQYENEGLIDVDGFEKADDALNFQERNGGDDLVVEYEDPLWPLVVRRE